MMRFTTIALCAALALASTAGSANPGKGQKPDMPMTQEIFQKWDKNNNDQLTRQEFTQGVKGSGWYNRWDVDNNNGLTMKEFNEAGFNGPFGHWDADGNGTLSQQELYGGFHDWYDQDEDGNWTLGEWDDAGDSGWFDV